MMIRAQHDQIGEIVRASITAQYDVVNIYNCIKAADHTPSSEFGYCHFSGSNVVIAPLIVRVIRAIHRAAIVLCNRAAKPTRIGTRPRAILGLVRPVRLDIESIATCGANNRHAFCGAPFRMGQHDLGLCLIRARSGTIYLVSQLRRLALDSGLSAISARVRYSFLPIFFWIEASISMIALTITEFLGITTGNLFTAVSAIHYSPPCASV